MINLPLPTYDENGYRSYNSGGVEREVGELLYAFAKILKPLNILDLGTHKGISAAYFGLACQENEKGIVHTVEFDPAHYQEAQNLWNSMGVDKNIHQYKCKVEDLVVSCTYDLILIDTEPSTRFAELERFYPYLEPGGYVFIHDLNGHLSQLPSSNPDHPEFGWPYGELSERLKNMLKDREMIPFSFRNPRGLTGFYKPRLDDYEII